MDRYATLRQGLIGAWCPSISGGGLLIKDFSETRGNAVATAPSYPALPGGTALACNGSTTEASTLYTQRTLNGAAAASLSMWMYRAATSVQVCCGFAGTGGTGGRFSAIWFTDGLIYLSVESGFNWYSLPGTGWRSIVCLFSGSAANQLDRLRLFSNGVELPRAGSSGGVAAALPSTLGPFSLGRDQLNRYGAGALDDVRVYNRTLTPSEIRLIANQRGIGLLPTRHRRGSLLSQFWLNVAGTWKTAKPWINVGGTWKVGSPKIRAGGAWKG